MTSDSVHADLKQRVTRFFVVPQDRGILCGLGFLLSDGRLVLVYPDPNNTGGPAPSLHFTNRYEFSGPSINLITAQGVDLTVEAAFNLIYQQGYTQAIFISPPEAARSQKFM